MKFLVIIITFCFLPCINLHAQLPSAKPMPLDKIMAYKKGGSTSFKQTTPTSLPSEAKEYPRQVREIMMMRKVQKTMLPELNSLPSTRKPNFDAIIRKYKKI